MTRLGDRMDMNASLDWRSVVGVGRRVATLLLSVLVIGAFATAARSDDDLVDEINRAFSKHVEASEQFKTEAKAFVLKTWKERDENADPETFVVESLAVLSPRFADGLDAYDDEQYETAHDIMNGLSNDDDPYLAANAAVFAVKSLVEQGRVEEAGEQLSALLPTLSAAADAAKAEGGEHSPAPAEESKDIDLYTTYAAEMAFLRGYVNVENLNYDQAAIDLQHMLDRYPAASQRLRVSARQMLAELKSRVPERIGDVADLMAYAGRRMTLSDTGERVQERQQRAIELLDTLIKEAEQSEQSSSSGGGSSGGQTPNSPMQDSQLPGGDGSSTNLRSNRRVQPGDAWGSMPPAEREKILQSLRDSFPSRYRQLIEQYYQELSKQP